MKEIKLFLPEKYLSSHYIEMKNGSYKFHDEYVVTLSFIQESEYNEGKNAHFISQYPLEDILDKYCVYISDFYEELNTNKSQICYLEFASSDIKDVYKLSTELVGKHVYNKEINKERVLIIE